jgi:DMSO/TMAO reductase YedYZ molybdopterin-dependent catalytic subunit
VPLANVLSLVQPAANARFVVFHCADPMDESGTRYYEYKMAQYIMRIELVENFAHIGDGKGGY